MSSRSRNRTPLIIILRERAWRILKKYLPPTLFMETDLPSIRVIDPTSKRKSVETEDAPIAISMYLPGKPLFRIGGVNGVLIPLIRRRRENTYCTIVDDYYVLSMDRGPYYETLRRSLGNLPEEFRYFIENYMGINVSNVDTGIVDEISPEKFSETRIRRCYLWLGWYDGGMFSLLMVRPREILRERIINGDNVVLRVIQETTNSFG